MDTWLKNNSLIGGWAFREKILSAIQRSQEDISTWLPEWAELRKAIDLIA